MNKISSFNNMRADSSLHHGSNNEELPMESNMSYQDMLDYMVIVLVRELGENIAFKGGWVLNQLLRTDSRMTRDVDFSVEDYSNYENVKEVLLRVAKKFQDANFINEYRIKDNISERVSGGIDFYDNLGKKILGVDVGLHNIHWGVKYYTFDIIDANCFEIERMLSDKLIAITMRKRFRRTKDLYDLFIITSHFDFDYKKLERYVEIRGGAEWNNIPFSDTVIKDYVHAWNALVLTNLNGETLNKPAFEEVLLRYYTIALPLKNKEDYSSWNHKELMLYV